MSTCSKCKYFVESEGPTYHDCRESSPQVVSPQNKDIGKLGKILTVWPRVAKDEKACGKFALR